MKLTFYIVLIFLLTSVLASNTFVAAQTNDYGSRLSAPPTEEMDEDLAFGSADFVEVPSYRIVSPAKKGFVLSIIFTALLWILFFNLIKGKRSQG